MSKMLITDLYMLTMGQGFFDAGKKDEIGYFELFFRKLPKDMGYAVASGLRNVIKFVKDFGFTKSDIEYLRSLNKFSDEYLKYLQNMKFECDILAVPEGSVVFAYQPILQVRGPIIQAQLFEAVFLMYVNHASTVASRAARMVYAASGHDVIEQGPRSKHGESAAVEATVDAFIGGCAGTSCVESGRVYGLPLYGTMAHSFVKSFDSEAKAFEAYFNSFPDSAVFLLDNYNTLESGVPNAIKAAHGKKLFGVRLDSGDFENLSKQVRIKLDEAGMIDTRILASGSLDEYKIERIVSNGAPIDIFGVGEYMTGGSSFGLGMVYKLCAIERDGQIFPKMKISENNEKSSLPGVKRIYRLSDKDIIALDDEEVQGELLGAQIFKNGKLVYNQPTVFESRDYCTAQKEKLDRKFKMINDPSVYPVELSNKLIVLKEAIMKKEVLVVIDMVNGFVKFGALHSPIVDEITPYVVRLVKDFKSHGKQVIAFCDCHELNDPEFALFPPHCIKGTPEAELIPEIAVFEKDMTVFYKCVTDGMAMEGIRNFFTQNTFDSVTVVGCCTDICVQQFAIGLGKLYNSLGRKTEIIVPESAVATFDAPGHNAEKEHKKALSVMEKAGVKII